MHQTTSIQLLADPVASTWLGLNSPDDGATTGITLKLDTSSPIDAQIARYVSDQQTAAQKQNRNTRNAHNNTHLPPLSTLGLMLFRNDPVSAQYMKRNQLSAPIPKFRSLGLDSLLLLADTLLPGVDSTAATSSSTSDLIAFVNASGGEASPFQLIHSGVTLSELATVAGHAESNGSFNGNPLSNSATAALSNTTNSEQNLETRAAATTSGATPRSLNASFVSALPSIPPGRVVLLLVGDLLSYCNKDIIQMIAQMSRPFRSRAPEVLDQQLLAYCAQDACLVGSKVLVARDGCAVWRPQESNTAQGRRRATSILHSSSNTEAEKSSSLQFSLVNRSLLVPSNSCSLTCLFVGISQDQYRYLRKREVE